METSVIKLYEKRGGEFVSFDIKSYPDYTGKLEVSVDHLLDIGTPDPLIGAIDFVLCFSEEKFNTLQTLKAKKQQLYCQLFFGSDVDDAFHFYCEIVSVRVGGNKDLLLSLDPKSPVELFSMEITDPEIQQHKKANPEPEYKQIEFTTEGNVQYHVGFGGDIIPITVTNIKTGKTIQRQYQCQQRPIFGHDSLDIQAVEKILDDMINSIQTHVADDKKANKQLPDYLL